MKSEWIEAILAVEQTRSFSRSADMLYCSQSAVTRMVQSALQTIGVRLVDHIIVADGDFVSLRQNNSLD